MRGKRSKQYRKLMHQYGLTFGFREPYQVLLSSKIIQDAGRCKMRLGAMLENTLHGNIKPMITQCCIRHLYSTQESNSQEEKDAWIAVAKQAERRRCGHHELEEPLSELECMKSVVDPKESGTNKHRYVIATQDAEVRKWMRSNVAGVPMIYVARSVMILEPMGGKSEDVREREEKSKFRAGLKDRRGEAIGEKRKRDDEEGDGDDAGATTATPKKRKVKGPKGPNPLSVKKAKKTNKTTTTSKAEAERATKRQSAEANSDGHEGSRSATSLKAADGVLAEGAPKRKRKRKPKSAEASNGGNENEDQHDE